jgi:hypothetical protein
MPIGLSGIIKLPSINEVELLLIKILTNSDRNITFYILLKLSFILPLNLRNQKSSDMGIIRTRKMISVLTNNTPILLIYRIIIENFISSPCSGSKEYSYIPSYPKGINAISSLLQTGHPQVSTSLKMVAVQ